VFRNVGTENSGAGGSPKRKIQYKITSKNIKNRIAYIRKI